MPLSYISVLSRLGFFGCLIVITPSVFAADQEVDNLLAKMRNAYSAIKSAKFSTVVNFRKPPLHTTNYFLAPDKFRVDFPGKEAGINSFITDGKFTYFVPSGQDAQREPYDFERFFQMSPGHIETFSYFEWKKTFTVGGKTMGLDGSALKVVPNQEWNGKKWTVLEETKNSEKQVYHYYVDPKTYLVWRTTSLPFGATAYRVDTQFTKLELGISIPESKFKVSG